MLDDELASLLPIFIDETRERIEHLASALADLETDPKALAVVKRELHTVKGAARMMQFATLAELCHGAEDVLLVRGIEARSILQRVCDRLMELVDRVAATNEAPARQDDGE